jgi:hypothetical protein
MRARCLSCSFFSIFTTIHPYLLLDFLTSFSYFLPLRKKPTPVRGGDDLLNAKYGMGNKKDPTSTETYFNKGKDVDRLLKLVSDNFLDGQAIK